MFRLFFAVAASFLFSMLGWAQNTDADTTSDYIKARGIVQDEENLQPLPYATIAVVCYSGENPRDTLRQVVDDNGRFEIALPPRDKYSFSAQFVGMKSQPAEFTREKLQTAGLVRLSMVNDENMLDEVTITAEKPLVRLGNDRIAYNVKDDPISKSLNLRDMMSRVPLVTIDGEGDLQVKGSKDFQIYLNGRPSTFISSNPKEVLRSIPASSIQSIEVITNPGVEYDASGASVILNIITEKNLNLKGILATVSAGSMAHQGFFESANITAAFGKASLNIGFSGFEYWRKKWDTYTLDETTWQQEISKSHNKMDKLTSRMYTVDVGFNYEFDKKNLLSTGFTFNHMGYRFYGGEIETKTFDSKDLDHPLYSTNTRTENNHREYNYEARIDYQHSFSRPKEQIVFSYLFVHNPTVSSDTTRLRYMGHLEEESPVLEGSIFSQNNTSLDEHTGQVDYTLPFNELHTLYTGLKYIHRRGSSNPIYNSPKDQEGFFKTMGYGSEAPMSYLQEVFAAYAKYRLSLEKFDFTLGARYEGGDQKVNYLENFSHTFHDFVPEVGASYSFSPQLQLKASYNLRVKRPTIQQLNPYTQNNGGNTINQGNIRLRNELQHNAEFSLGSYGQKLVLQASLDARYVRNPIASVTRTYENNSGMLLSTFENIGYARGVGSNLFLRYSPIKWFNLIVNSSARFDDFYGGEALVPSTQEIYERKNSGWSGQAFTILNFMLPRSWDISVVGGMFSLQPTLSTSTQFGWVHNFTVSKKLLDGNLNIFGAVTNPFMKFYKIKFKTFGPGFEKETLIQQRALVINIGLSYTFGELKSPIKKVEKTIENTDLSETKEAGQVDNKGTGNPMRQ